MGFSCTTKITELWNVPEFLYCDHTHFLWPTRPHSSVLLSVVSSRSQLNWLDQVRRVSLDHSMAVDRYEFIDDFCSIKYAPLACDFQCKVS